MGQSTLCACGRVSAWGDVTSASFDNKAADIKGPVTAEEVASHFSCFCAHTDTAHTRCMMCVCVWVGLLLFMIKLTTSVTFMYLSGIYVPKNFSSTVCWQVSACINLFSLRNIHQAVRRTRPLKDSSRQLQCHLPKYICTRESSSPSLLPPLSNSSLSQSFRKWNKTFHLSLQMNIESVYQWSTFVQMFMWNTALLNVIPLKYKQ